MRRRGIAVLLLEHILERGRKRGFRLAQLTTLLGIAAATRAYEKTGFKVAEEKRHPEFERLIGAPGLVRYERFLGAAARG